MTGGEITTHDKVLATREDRAKKGQDLCDRTRSGSWPKWNERCFPTVSVEDYIHDTLQVVELNCVSACNFDPPEPGIEGQCSTPIDIQRRGRISCEIA